jgi:hypothetical protein
MKISMSLFSFSLTKNCLTVNSLANANDYDFAFSYDQFN